MIRDGLVVAGLDPAERNRFHGVPAEGRLWIRLVPRQEEAPGDPLHLAAAPTGTRVIVEAERRAVGDKVTA